MTFDLFGGRRLLLAGTRLGWFWIGVGVVALVLVLVLYREERRLVSRQVGLWLLGLRLAAAGVLVLSLFEPIATRSYRETVKGRVVVAVDVSESMATADPGRSAGDKARLAKVLGLGPETALDGLSRREVARRLLASGGSPVGKLAGDHAVDAVTFARETLPTTPSALSEALRSPGKPDDPSALTTDWEPALARAMSEAEAPVLGVVLLTDGRRNAPGDASATIDRLAARGIPVYPVAIGSTAPPRDAAIATIKAPEGVYKGDVANVEATLKLDGYAGREVAVTLERPGAEPIRQSIRAPADGSRPVVAFRVPMDELGTIPLTVAIAPLDGDARPDNDRRTASVQVADDKARVLLVDGEAGWEFRYLRNALARDPRVQLDAVVFHQPELAGTSAPPTYAKALPPRPEASAKLPDPLGNFDAIVVGDVAPADLDDEAWTRLESYVSDRGGTLILGPGPRSASGPPSEAARRLRPVSDPRPILPHQAPPDPAHPSLPHGVTVLPAPTALTDANAWPMLQLTPDPEGNLAAWQGLPRLPRVLAGKAKPGAATLASLRDEPGAVIAAQPYGLGKVLWVGTDSTWRWRYRVGDTYHHRFWGQVVRWASSGRLTSGNAYVRFGPARPKVSEGETPLLRARIVEGVPGVGPDLLLAARVYKADPRTKQPTGDAVAVVPLRGVAGQPRAFEGSGPPLPLGNYLVRLDVPALAGALHLDDDKAVPQATLEVVARETSERVELAADRASLDRLAAATGGRVLADYEADELPALLHSQTRQALRVEETPLWDHPGTLLAFFAILTAEWILKKRAGLP